MSGIIRIAHRGASGYGHAPENTLAAFRKAIEIGVDAVECDVQCTKDGQVVVIHDSTLNRTTDKRGVIQKLTLDEVKEADAGSSFDPIFKGERIPTLREVLEVAKGKVTAVVEIKQENISDKVIKEIESMGSVEESVLISFHASALKDAQEINPSIPRALLIGGSKWVKRVSVAVELVQKAFEVGANTLDLSSKIITPGLVQKSHRREVDVWAWTVDDEEEMKELVSMGVDGITSNYPDRLNSVLSAKPA